MGLIYSQFDRDVFGVGVLKFVVADRVGFGRVEAVNSKSDVVEVEGVEVVDATGGVGPGGIDGNPLFGLVVVVFWP